MGDVIRISFDLQLVAAQLPEEAPETIHAEIVGMLDTLLGKGRIKTVSTIDADAAFEDALGDMYVVQTNLAEQVKVPMEDCIQAAWDEIKNRKGKMVDGLFVKEADL